MKWLILRKKCTKNSRFRPWSTWIQNGMFLQIRAPTKVNFHSLERQLPQNMSSRNKICLFILSICLGVPYHLQSIPCHWELFLVSMFTEKNLPYYFIHLRQASCISGPASCLSALRNHLVSWAMWHLRGSLNYFSSWFSEYCILTHMKYYWNGQFLWTPGLTSTHNEKNLLVVWARWMAALLNSISH